MVVIRAVGGLTYEMEQEDERNPEDRFDLSMDPPPTKNEGEHKWRALIATKPWPLNGVKLLSYGLIKAAAEVRLISSEEKAEWNMTD